MSDVLRQHHVPRQTPRFPEPPESLKRIPLLGRQDLAWINATVASIPEQRSPGWWKGAMTFSLTLSLLCAIAIIYVTSTGLGVWGVNHPVMWGWAIINFVWWIGIGHAGTLISAILFLMRQRWRTSINRAAEVMTLFAVLCASIFPLIHLGRPWLAWWLLPIPTSNGVWPQFKSPLVWDVFAVGAYFTVSLMFCYVGLLPDLAIMRDRARSRRARLAYGILALGWTGSARHWNHYQKCYLILAGLSTALVISVHSIVSLDFAVSQIPGWHSTLFPPYFVLGAIFSGLAMVLMLILPLRHLLKLGDIITPRHIDLVCKVALGISWLLAYAYAMESIAACFGGSSLDKQRYLMNRAADPWIVAPLAGVAPSPHWQAFWAMLVCNILAPQIFWFKRARGTPWMVFLIAAGMGLGMWLERYLIIVASLQRDFVPANWGGYAPTATDVLTFAGSFGIFLTLFLLFIRMFPIVAIAEVKSICQTAPPASSHHANSNRLPASPQGSVPGVMAVFDNQTCLLRAAREIRARQLQRWDVFTPFPVPEMERVMGLSRSRIGWIAFACGTFGFIGGMTMVWWMNSVNYPLQVGGKPLFSPWAAFPTAFELAILFAAIGAVASLLFFTHLPRWHQPRLQNHRFASASNDRFVLVVEADSSTRDLSETARCLQTAGAIQLEWLKE
jgi:Ni/Fe-hydrogenase subunit HybB-like protein